ncbi:MAG: exopolyphosphatase [Streptosporangiaceae bacterium]
MTGDGPGRSPARPAPSPAAPPEGARRVAAIDCGTNSLRLLIADADLPGRRLTDLTRRMEIVRLGQGVDAAGRLAPDALERTFAVLADYASAIAAAGTSAVRMVATSATRDAANAADFAAGVTRILGVPPEVISGQEEAALSYAGATGDLPGAGDGGGGPAAAVEPGGAAPPRPPYLVTDIGGGSTEFVVGSTGARPGAAGAAGELAAISVDIGCVRMTERHLRSDPPSPGQVAAATADINTALATVAASIPVKSARTLVGLAGSVTTVTGIALGLPGYDPARIHHTRLTAGQVHEVTASLLRQSHAERARIGVMHPGRVDVIGAGSLILDRIMTVFGFAELITSEHDILDGIAWSIAAGAR